MDVLTIQILVGVLLGALNIALLFATYKYSKRGAETKAIFDGSAAAVNFGNLVIQLQAEAKTSEKRIDELECKTHLLLQENNDKSEIINQMAIKMTALERQADNYYRYITVLLRIMDENKLPAPVMDNK
jgi:hypothetical protein